jgi:threonine synthase
VAGVKLLAEHGIIGAGDRVVSVLTGHLLKDPDAALATRVAGGLGADQPLSRAEALEHLARVLSTSSPR